MTRRRAFGYNRRAMRIIDRYMLRQFFAVFAICAVSLTGLYIVIDAFTNLDKFLSVGEERGGLFAVLGIYYANQSIAFFDRTSGVVTLIAAMFTVTWIQRNNEMTALEAAGVRKFRVLAPVVAASLAIGLLAAANRELVIPQIRHNLGRDVNESLGDAPTNIQPRYDNETEILFRGEKAYAKERRIERPSFLLPPLLSRNGKVLFAESATFLPADESHPSGYLLKKVDEPRNIDERPSIPLGERTVIFTRRDHPWLGSREAFVASDVDVEMLAGDSTWKSYASTRELIRGLKNQAVDFGADVRVTIHARIVQPLLDATLLFLGLPLVVSRAGRNIFLAIGLCLGLAIAFFLVVIGCQTMGNSYWIAPSLAAWLPLIVFVPVAVGLSDSLRE